MAVLFLLFCWWLPFHFLLRPFIFVLFQRTRIISSVYSLGCSLIYFHSSYLFDCDSFYPWHSAACFSNIFLFLPDALNCFMSFFGHALPLIYLHLVVKKLSVSEALPRPSTVTNRKFRFYLIAMTIFSQPGKMHAVHHLHVHDVKMCAESRISGV